MSTYYTLEYLAIWEDFNNPDFNRMVYQSVKNVEGQLIISPKRWIETTNAGVNVGFYSYRRHQTASIPLVSVSMLSLYQFDCIG